MNTKALIAEFVATFTLVFVGVGAAAQNYVSGGAVGLVGIALAYGVAICVMASAVAAISGGHLNPAVTFSMLVTGQISFSNAIGYWISQLLAGAAAVGVVGYIHDSNTMIAMNHGVPALAEGLDPMQGMVLEAVLTFFLVFVIFGTAVDRRAPKLGALLIGLTVTIDILVGGRMTGAAMNPAVWFGPAINGGGWDNAWVYIVGPCLGGAIAALLYKGSMMEEVPDTSG